MLYSYILRIIYWCIFDFGLCIYTTAAAAFAFTLLFRNWICLEPEKYGDMLLAICTSTSFACSAILSPTLGAVADVLGTRVRFLTVCVCLIFAGCVLLSIPGRGDIIFAMLIFIVANASLDISYVFYNALLPEIAGEHRIGLVSNLGAVFNFVGGLLSLALSYLILNFAGLPQYGGLRRWFQSDLARLSRTVYRA
jgi:UMF1 family MFS transporter